MTVKRINPGKRLAEAVVYGTRDEAVLLAVARRSHEHLLRDAVDAPPQAR